MGKGQLIADNGQAIRLPLIGAALDINNVPAQGVFQVLADLCAAPARMADDINIAVRVYFLDATRYLTHGNMGGTLRVHGGPFVVFAHIDKLRACGNFGWLYVLHTPQSTCRALAAVGGRRQVLQNRLHAAVILAGIQPQLDENIGYVLGHRGIREHQLGGDVLIGLPARHQL